MFSLVSYFCPKQSLSSPAKLEVYEDAEWLMYLLWSLAATAVVW